MAEKLSECTFPSLHSCREASAVGQLLDFRGRGLFCLTFSTAPMTHSYCLRHLNDDPLLLSSLIPLNLFREASWCHH